MVFYKMHRSTSKFVLRCVLSYTAVRIKLYCGAKSTISNHETNAVTSH